MRFWSSVSRPRFEGSWKSHARARWRGGRSFEIRCFGWFSGAQYPNKKLFQTAGGFLKARASLNPFERFNHPSCTYAWLLIHKQANLNKS